MHILLKCPIGIKPLFSTATYIPYLLIPYLSRLYPLLPPLSIPWFYIYVTFSTFFSTPGKVEFMIFCSTNMMHHVFIIFFNLKFNLYSNNGTWDMEKLSCMLLMRTKKVHFLYPDAFKKPACPRPRLNTMNRTLFIYFHYIYILSSASYLPVTGIWQWKYYVRYCIYFFTRKSMFSYTCLLPFSNRFRQQIFPFSECNINTWVQVNVGLHNKNIIIIIFFFLFFFFFSLYKARSLKKSLQKRDT